MTYTVDPAANNQPATTTFSTEHPGQLTLEVGQMAHGGHCIARHEDRVVLVRHAIPGEVVVAQLTKSGPRGRYWWADTVKVLQASEFRRAHQWKLADSLRAYSAGRRPINEAQLGHIVLEHQRRLKAHAFRDAMIRLGHQHADDVEVSVNGLENDEPTGLQWRTRHAFTVSADRLSMPVKDTSDSVIVRNIPLAVPQLDKLQLWGQDFSGAAQVMVATPGHTRDALLVIIPLPEIANSPELLKPQVAKWRSMLDQLPSHVSGMVAVPKKRGRHQQVEVLKGNPWVEEKVVSEQWGTRTFRASGAAFWQPHRDGAATLVNAVMQAADAQSGQTIIDLYGGTGLFARYLSEAVGADGAVLSVDSDPVASRDASHNLDDLPQTTVLQGKANRVMASWLQTPDAAFDEGGLNNQHVDTVVMNPPSKGAGRGTIKRLEQLNPGKIVYVSSDPVSLARDTRRLSEQGWQLDSVQAYDLAPETYHLDTVCVFTRRA